jgi:hypothetical protein
MPANDHPSNVDLEDWALIIEALAQWAGNPNELLSEREERAYELIEEIAAKQGIPAEELVRQGGSSWYRD